MSYPSHNRLEQPAQAPTALSRLYGLCMLCRIAGALPQFDPDHSRRNRLQDAARREARLTVYSRFGVIQKQCVDIAKKGDQYRATLLFEDAERFLRDECQIRTTWFGRNAWLCEVGEKSILPSLWKTPDIMWYTAELGLGYELFRGTFRIVVRTEIFKPWVAPPRPLELDRFTAHHTNWRAWLDDDPGEPDDDPDGG